MRTQSAAPTLGSFAVVVGHEQEFAVIRLGNEAIEIAVVPELGAKLISLRNLRSGREWLWRPPGPRRLFRSPPGGDFAASALVGADECLPTITPCAVAGRPQPDHGEVWTQAWTLDEAALSAGIVRTSVQLSLSPLHFTRTITLEGATVRLDYLLVNQSAEPVPYLWALHPLLAFLPGDRLQLPSEITTVSVETARQPDASSGTHWDYPHPQPGVDLQSLRLGVSAYAKFFAGPLLQGNAAIVNERTGDQLEMSWDAAINPHVGVWLTRGGWQGYHHLAIEPSNAPTDSLAVAAEKSSSKTVLRPHEKRAWRIALGLAQQTAAQTIG